MAATNINVRADSVLKQEAEVLKVQTLWGFR